MSSKERPLSVVFVDDDDRLLDEWRGKWQEACPKGKAVLEDNKTADTKSEIFQLSTARHGTRKDPRHVVAETPLFNKADLVLVDYDLIELEQSTALTGEDIAYLLRCFTTCGVIVLLNPPDLGTNFFDLRLRRSMDSWADLQLGTDQLGNGWLWNKVPEGFAPWHWPQLLEMVERRRRQVAEMRSALDKVALDTIGIPEEVRASLDHSMTDVLTARRVGKPAGVKPLTAREFVLKSEYGVHRKDRPAFKGADEQMARIAAARMSSWLESVVLPGQNVLVDAPHLVRRSPGLLSGDQDKVGSWNATAVRESDAASRAVRSPDLSQYRFKKETWLSRPAWFWPLVASSKRFMEWAQPSTQKDFVFCEDTSAFCPRSEAHEFMADVPPQFSLRHVKMGTGKANPPVYRPPMRLSM